MDSQETYAVEKALAETPPEAITATDALLKSFARPASRRSMLKGAVATAAGAALASSTIITAGAVHADGLRATTTNAEIFSIAATAETLAVTFYNTAIAMHHQLGIHDSALLTLKAIAYEEDIHRSFFIANGGTVATNTFSFPRGMDTFESLGVFVATQQQLEVVFDSAFLLAIKVFAQKGMATVAQISGQIACVEQGHLVAGRMLAGFSPAEPYVFTPVLFSNFGQVVPTVKSAGYLSPVKGNSYTYSPAEVVFVVDKAPGDTTVLNAL